MDQTQCCTLFCLCNGVLLCFPPLGTASWGFFNTRFGMLGKIQGVDVFPLILSLMDWLNNAHLASRAVLSQFSFCFGIQIQGRETGKDLLQPHILILTAPTLEGFYCKELIKQPIVPFSWNFCSSTFLVETYIWLIYCKTFKREGGLQLLLHYHFWSLSTCWRDCM